MSKLTVEFEWDDKDLGGGWFNIDNLGILLYSRQFTTREILKVREVGFATLEDLLPKKRWEKEDEDNKVS